MLRVTKESWIGPFVENRRVLDLGCACHQFGRTDLPSLHAFIVARAEHTVGVDYLPEEVQKMQAEGYEVLCADVESMDLGQTFDVVVAGDIIEHLSNPGAFLTRARAHLNPGGLLLVTTPNPVTLERYFRVLLREVHRLFPRAEFLRLGKCLPSFRAGEGQVLPLPRL